MIEGPKVVIGILALVILVGLITFAIYLMTRQDDADGEGVFTPNAIVACAAAADMQRG